MNPNFSASLIRCSIRLTGRISPDRPTSPARHTCLSISVSMFEERIALIKSWIPDDDGLNDCEIDLWDMYADYINGIREISEINMDFTPEYITKF